MYTRPAYLWLLWLLQSLLKLYWARATGDNANALGENVNNDGGKALVALAFVLSFAMFILGFALPCTQKTYTDIFDAGGFAYLAFGSYPIVCHTWRDVVGIPAERGFAALALFLMNSGSMYLAWGLTSTDISCAPAGIALGAVSLTGGLWGAASLLLE